MMKYLAVVIFTLSVKCYGFPFNLQNDELTFGDACTLSTGENGICRSHFDCESAQMLVNQRRNSEIVRCGFDGKTPIVCCPQRIFFKKLCKNGAIKSIIDNKIHNGNKSNVGEFPFQVALGRKTLEGVLDFNCGGSLIADDVVLTAAHCLNNRAISATMVRLGRTSLNLNNDDDDSIGEDIDIQTVVLHQKYNYRSKHNDIALLKLKKPASLTNDYIKTICLSTDDKNLPTNFTITGFGITNTTTQTRSDWMQFGVVQSYAHDDCQNTMREHTREVIDTQYCANSLTGVDACQGDSGGPLSYDINGIYYLYGVTSYGAGCGSRFPAIYTKVNQYLDWIQDEISKF